VVVIALLRQIASAIDHLHERGPVVHGNLQPNNVLLDTESGTQIQAFVSDFGVAELVACGIRGFGTPPYIGA